MDKTDPSGKCIEDLCIGEAIVVGEIVEAVVDAVEAGEAVEGATTAAEGATTAAESATNAAEASEAQSASEAAQSADRLSGARGPRPNGGDGPPHGAADHNAAIDKDIAKLKEDPSVTIETCVST